MVNAIVLMTVERDKVNYIAQELAEIEGVSEVYSVAGKYDLVAILRTKKSEVLAELVTDNMLKIQGIISSETLVSFRVYSRHDLESIFAIGQE
jgi:DNA-binding Lrp family transcriptional regulator